jgi:hypothetical protein
MSYSRTLDKSSKQSAINRTLSVPVQAGLLVSLCSLTLWTLYFSSYPAVHNAMHHMRHGTAAVACH